MKDLPADDSWKGKASAELLLQIDLKQKQIESPTPERLQRMKEMGLDTGDLTRQKIFLYLNQQLSGAQIKELQEMSIQVYPDSWIPPVGVFPTGYYLAEAPVNAIPALAAKEYAVRLDTAEKLLQPQRRPQ